MGTVDTASPYEVNLYITPADNLTYNGTAFCYIGLPTSTSDPLVDSIVAGVSFSSGAYFGLVTERSSSSVVGNVVGTNYTDDPNAPGVLTIRVDPTTFDIDVYWRRQLAVPRLRQRGRL